VCRVEEKTRREWEGKKRKGAVVDCGGGGRGSGWRGGLGQKTDLDATTRQDRIGRARRGGKRLELVPGGKASRG
jgi:hypothetical protein